MAKVVTPIVCKVEVISKAKQSSYGEGQTYHAVLFSDTSYPVGSDEAKIWKNLTPNEVEQIHKGDTVQLVPVGQDKNGKEKHQIVVLTPANGKTEVTRAYEQRDLSKPRRSQQWTDDEKRAIANKVVQDAKLMRFCLQTAKVEFGDLIESEESLRSLATTLFIGVTR